jgi:hypothetical protein
MVAPTVRASTTQRARKSEVFDKMTTVRGFGSNDGGDALKSAIAAVMESAKEGRNELSRISEKLSGQERSQHAKDMKRGKR